MEHSRMFHHIAWSMGWWSILLSLCIIICVLSQVRKRGRWGGRELNQVHLISQQVLLESPLYFLPPLLFHCRCPISSPHLLFSGLSYWSSYWLPCLWSQPYWCSLPTTSKVILYQHMSSHTHFLWLFIICWIKFEASFLASAFVPRLLLVYYCFRRGVVYFWLVNYLAVQIVISPCSSCTLVWQCGIKLSFEHVLSGLCAFPHTRNLLSLPLLPHHTHPPTPTISPQSFYFSVKSQGKCVLFPEVFPRSSSRCGCFFC